MTDLNVLGISGSPRAGSFNTALLRNAQKHAPAGMNVSLHEGLDQLPHYNQDLDSEESLPESVARLRRATADAVRAQLALRQVFLWTHSHVVIKPELMLFGAAQRFDDAGNITDETTVNLLRDLLSALRDQIRG